MSWSQIFQHELKTIFSDRALLLTVFGGIIFYSFLYPLPYAQQLPRNQNVVVVDLDNSQLSRKLIRMVNATPEILISRYAGSLQMAQHAIVEDGLAGMMVIPKHFYRDLMQGRKPTLSYAGDASYFLVYSKVVSGLVVTGKTLAAEVKVSRLLVGGQALAQAKQQYSAMRLDTRPVFNPTGGYVNYVVPAVFILILHQTLLIGIGLISGTQNEKTAAGEKGYWQQASAGKLILTRAFIFLLIYLLMSAYYFGFCFEFYNISRLAHPLDLIQLSLAFILATTFFGLFISQLLPRRELATVLVLLSSLPIVFSAGFVWPVNMLPAALHNASQLIPAIPGIQAFLKLNQMGAEFYQIRALYWQLWLQAGVYGGLSWWLVNRKRQSMLILAAG